MAVCVAVGVDNVLSLDTVTPTTDCVFVLVQSAEFTAISGLNALFADYFQFDPDLFSMILLAYFLSFLSGHILGRIVSGLKKAG